MAKNSDPRQSCINCHFLMKGCRDAGVDGLSPAEREKIREGDYSSFEHYAIGCWQKVWDEGYQFDKAKRHELIVETDRRGFCFFWSHRPGMMFPAASELQKRESQEREASRDRKLTICGLWIAAFALVADFILRLLRR